MEQQICRTPDGRLWAANLCDGQWVIATDMVSGSEVVMWRENLVPVEQESH